MINYRGSTCRVLQALRSEGCNVLEKAMLEYGKFGWVVDRGNKVEPLAASRGAKSLPPSSCHVHSRDGRHRIRQDHHRHASSAAMGWPFYDADDFHSPENIRKMASGVPLTDEDRGPWLEELRELICRHNGRGERTESSPARPSRRPTVGRCVLMPM